MSERNFKSQGAKPGEPGFPERRRAGGDGKTEASGLSIEKAGADPSAAQQPGSDGPPAEGWDPYDRRGRIATDPGVPSAQRKPSRIIVTSRHQPGLFERFLKKLGGTPK